MNRESIIGYISKDIQLFQNQNPNGIIIIRGATATGKTGFAIDLAKDFELEIISCDSRQIFRYMDIGTDKVSKEIREKIPHHQIDIVDPDENYTAGEWKKDCLNQIKGIQKNNKLTIITGGTGLYIDTIYKNFTIPDAQPDKNFRERMYNIEKQQTGKLHEKLLKIDPEEAMKIHPKSLRCIIRALEIHEKTGLTKSQAAKEQKVEQPIMMIGLRREKEETNIRINKRIKEMLKIGLIDEVQSLLDRGYDENLQSMNGIGYKEIIGYIKGEYDLEKAKELLKRNTHRYAKRQRTWFRRYINDAHNHPKEDVEYKVYNLG